VHVIACRFAVVGGFPQEKELVVADLGGQPHEALQILTVPFSKASPGAYSTYRNVILCFLYFSMHVLYCALHIGFLNEVVIGCMVVPFHMYHWFRSILPLCD
jgi:hypothetical protein